MYLILVYDLSSFLICCLPFPGTCKYLFLELFLLLLFLLLYASSDSFPMLMTMYLVFFSLYIIFFSSPIYLQFCIPFLMLTAVPTAAVSSIKIDMPISTLPYHYFTASWIAFTLDVDAQHITGPNMVICFTTFTVIFDVFPTGVSTAMIEVLFISYKLLIVPGLYSR